MCTSSKILKNKTMQTKCKEHGRRWQLSEDHSSNYHLFELNEMKSVTVLLSLHVDELLALSFIVMQEHTKDLAALQPEV